MQLTIFGRFFVFVFYIVPKTVGRSQVASPNRQVSQVSQVYKPGERGRRPKLYYTVGRTNLVYSMPWRVEVVYDIVRQKLSRGKPSQPVGPAPPALEKGLSQRRVFRVLFNHIFYFILYTLPHTRNKRSDSLNVCVVHALFVDFLHKR